MRNGVLRGYIVLYKKTGNISPDHELRVEPNVTSTNITGLSPWQQYDIQVVGYTGRGRSPSSELKQARTLPTGE